jgi:hypothetical protein
MHYILNIIHSYMDAPFWLQVLFIAAYLISIITIWFFFEFRLRVISRKHKDKLGKETDREIIIVHNKLRTIVRILFIIAVVTSITVILVLS